MKMAKKLAAVLLAGVLALSALTACSGSAGPLTKDNVTDYIIDYYKTNGYQAEEEQSMESAAQAVLAYVNSQIGKSEYNGMALREAFSAIIEDADEDTRKGWMSSVTLKDGYFYCVSCASVNETYRTDLFNQGKTALIAAVLSSDQCEIRSYIWEQAPERWPSDAGVCVIEGVIGGKGRHGAAAQQGRGHYQRAVAAKALFYLTGHGEPLIFLFVVPHFLVPPVQ